MMIGSELATGSFGGANPLDKRRVSTRHARRETLFVAAGSKNAPLTAVPDGERVEPHL
jgi:hypothetical protein